MSEARIVITADAGKAVSEIDRLKAAFSNGMKSVESSASFATKAIGLLAAGGLALSFANSIKGAIQAADEMGKMAQKIGINVEQVAGLQLAYQQAGLSATDMQKSLGKLAAGIADGSDALTAMGVATKNTDGTLKSTREVLGSVSDKFKDYEDGAAKTALAIKLFGKSGADLIPLLNGGGQALNEFDAMALKLGLTMDKTATDNAEKFNDTMELVGMGATGVSRQIAAQLLPTLSGLAGQFLTSMTSGDKLKKTADFLSTGLKGLYVVALGVVEVFTTVGKVVGGGVAAIAAALSGDFTGAMAIMREAKSDIGSGWKDTLAQMSAAWNSTGDASLEAMAKTTKALKGSAPVVKDAGKGVKELADEFGKLRDKINGKDSGTDVDFIKNLMLLKQGFDSGRVSMLQYLELADKYVSQQKYSVDAAKAAEDAQKVLNKVMEEYAEANKKGVAEAITAATEAEKKLATYGMLESAVQSLTLAHLTESRELAALAGEDVANIDKRIVAQERLIAATKGIEDKGVAEKQLKALSAEGKKFTDDLERGLTDSLYRAFESGKGFFSTLWSGIKNLFKTTALKLIVNTVMGGSGATLGTFANAASSFMGGGGSGGAGGSGILSSISSLGSVVSGLSGAVSAFTGAFSAGATLGTAGISSGVAMIGSATGASSVLAGVGQVLGGLGPVGWAALAAIAVIGFASGRGETRSGATYDTGADGMANKQQGPSGGEINGGAARAAFDATQQAIRGTLSAVGSKAVLTGFTAGLESSKNGKGFEFAGGLINGVGFGESGGRDGRQFAMKSQDGEAAFKGYILQLKQSTIEALQAATDLPKSISDKLAGVDASSLGADAIDKIMAEINAVVVSVGNFQAAVSSLPFDNLKGLAFDAAAGLLAAAGGLANLESNLATYYQNFYSEEEQRASKILQINAATAGSGLDAATATRETFRALVDGQDLTTESGRTTYASLLSVAGALSGLLPPLDDVKDKLKETISEIMEGLTKEREGLEANLLDAQGNGTGAAELRRQKAIVGFTEAETAAYDYNRAIETQITVLNAATTAAETLAQSLRNFASERSSLEADLLDAQGNTGGASEARRAVAIAGFTDAEIAAYDFNTELRKTITGLNDATAAAATLASTNRGLSDQLALLKGTETTRSLALRDATDETTKALLRQIFAQEDLNTAVEQAVETAARALSTATTNANDAYAGLQRAVEAQKAQELATYNAAKKAAEVIFKAQVSAAQAAADGVKKSLATIGESLGKLKALSGSLKNTLDGLRIIGSEEAFRTDAQAQIRAALATARSGGGLPLDGKLDSALATISKPSEMFFTSFTDYARDFFKTANDIAELSSLTDVQITADEITQAILQDQDTKLQKQIELLKDGFADQVSTLDGILENAKNQLDAANGINIAVLSVADALVVFNDSITALITEREKQNLPTTGFQPVTATSYNAADGAAGQFITDLYASVAQKGIGDIDQQGYSYWLKEYKTLGALQTKDNFSASVKAIRGYAVGTNYVPRDMLAQIHEGEAIVPKAYNPAAGGGTNNSELVAEMRALRLEVQGLRAEAAATAGNTAKTARVMERIVPDGDALQTRAIV